jgi:hypothetical protein
LRRLATFRRPGPALLRRQDRVAFPIVDPDQRSSGAQKKLGFSQSVIDCQAGAPHCSVAIRQGMNAIDRRHWHAPSLTSSRCQLGTGLAACCFRKRRLRRRERDLRRDRPRRQLRMAQAKSTRLRRGSILAPSVPVTSGDTSDPKRREALDSKLQHEPIIMERAIFQ